MRPVTHLDPDPAERIRAERGPEAHDIRIQRKSLASHGFRGIQFLCLREPSGLAKHAGTEVVARERLGIGRYGALGEAEEHLFFRPAAGPSQIGGVYTDGLVIRNECGGCCPARGGKHTKVGLCLQIKSSDHCNCQ